MGARGEGARGEAEGKGRGEGGERARDGLNLRKPRNIVSDLWPGEDRPTRYSSHDESATTLIGCARAKHDSRLDPNLGEIGLAPARLSAVRIRRGL